MSRLRNLKPNNAAVGAMAVGPEVRAVLAEIAERAEREAKALAEDFRQSGEYLDSFEVEIDVGILAGEKRAIATLRNTSPYAGAVEFGNAHDHKAHHVLERTLDGLAH